LSPAYDLNPVPTETKPRVLTLAINEEDTTASLAIAMEVAGYFDLEEAQAREIAVQVARATSRWRAEAATQGIAKGEIARMASAFEHEDLKEALGKLPI
jgi:serine/threonine-protein kinase HipA